MLGGKIQNIHCQIGAIAPQSIGGTSLNFSPHKSTIKTSLTAS
jgi:hypothetical protein